MELYKDILEAPHTLVAGTTGSGKSVVLNGIIRELMETKTPADASLILIDPKRVELSQYRDTTFCKAYTHEAEKAIDYLDSAISEMEDRFAAMEQAGAVKTDKYHIYIVIDELADLMISEQSRQIRLKLQKILQLGRAAGIHIIAATQAPNRQIIPANLVLNFTNRIALRCLSSIESRQIVNVSGAELLPQYGKGLYLSPKGMKRVDIPLTPDNTDLIQKWHRPAPKEETPEEITIVVDNTREKSYSQYVGGYPSYNPDAYRYHAPKKQKQKLSPKETWLCIKWGLIGLVLLAILL